MNYRDEIFMKMRNQASKIVDVSGVIADAKRQISDQVSLKRNHYEIAINPGKYAIADSDSTAAAVVTTIWMWCEQNGFGYSDQGWYEDDSYHISVDPWYNYLATC